jgi:glycosyl transferase family 2
MMKPILSVVIPVKGVNKKYTYPMLMSLAQGTKIPYEVLIFDSPSDDRFQPGGWSEIPLSVEYSQNLHVGMYELLNRTVARAKGDVFAILNNDINLGPKTLDHCVEAIREFGDSDNVHSVICAPSGSGAVLPSGFYEEALRRSELPTTLEGPVFEWRGWFIVVSRKAWEELGGFDERFLLYCGDNDFFYRLKRAGYASRQVANTWVHHFESGTARPLWFDHNDDYRAFETKWGRTAMEPF